MMLTPKQARFVQEYLLDLNGKQAAIRAGYSPKTAEVQGSRLRGHPKIQAAIDTAMQARSRRTQVSADRVVTEFAKVAFANMGDYWSRSGELDLSGIDQDRMAAVEEIAIDETVDHSGVLHRRIRLKLRDKISALDSLARYLGMFANRHFAAGSIEAEVMAMTPEERVARAQEILEGARKYLPLLDEYERKQAEKAKAGS